MAEVPIVEDETVLAEPFAFLLQREGFEVRMAADGQEAFVEFSRVEPDIVLLDLMLPGMSGTKVCKNIRLKSSALVITVTVRDTETDKVVGLEIGADDYVTESYSSRELIARTRAVLRRGHHDDSDGAEDLYEEVLRGGPAILDVERHVVAVDGGDATMPLKEFDLLEYLLCNRGRIFTRGQLIDRTWGSDYVDDTKILDVHARRLRSKIERNPPSPESPVAVCGLGYRFEDQCNRLLPTISTGGPMELRC